MKRVLKLAAVAAAGLVVLGCGTLQLNPIVTGTACSTREACLKDLNLPNPEKPGYVFVVEPYTMDEKPKAILAGSCLNCPVYYGNVDLCIAKSLKDEFGNNAKILFTEKLEPCVTIKIKNIYAQSVYPYKMYIRMDYQLMENGKSIALTARTNAETFWNGNSESRKQYPEVCTILAKQVHEILDKDSANPIIEPGKAK